LKAASLADLASANDFNNFVWAVPTQFTRATLNAFKNILSNKRIVIATKGIEIGTGDLVINVFNDIIVADLSIISGPSFAKEVLLKSQQQ